MTSTSAREIDPSGDVVDLTRAICDLESVSGNETELADVVEAALRRHPHLRVDRDGDAVVARTHAEEGDRPGVDAGRVVLAGHLDTVPVARNLPTRIAVEGGEEMLVGRGTVDMKGGVAVQLALAARLTSPVMPVSYVFYDHEEVEAERNGLLRLSRHRPELLAADFAVLLEPTGGVVEGGCQGTLRVVIEVPGVAAHSARSWLGRNAIHDAGHVLSRLNAYQPREVEVEGLRYREGLNAVAIEGGIAGNVVPDRCRVTVNHRFAPDRSVADAERHVRDLFTGYDVTVVDAAPGARPGLGRSAAASFVAAVGGEPRAKYGWTDVARFAELGVPAVNFGPGDPSLAHRDDERVPTAAIRACHDALHRWLSGGVAGS